MGNILLRPGLIPKDTETVLIHMGAGAAQDAAKSAIRNYDEYADILPGLPGAFTVSVFAVTDEISVEDILGELPHSKYGVAKMEDLSKAGYTIWPTTIIDSPLPDSIRSAHYDIVVEGLGWQYPGIASRLLSKDQVAQLTAQLSIYIEPLMEHFAPRVIKEELKSVDKADHVRHSKSQGGIVP